MKLNMSLGYAITKTEDIFVRKHIIFTVLYADCITAGHERKNEFAKKS